MAFGLGKLRLSPDQFWAMSLREIDAAIEGYLGNSRTVTNPSRTTINEMMAQYPDHKNGL